MIDVEEGYVNQKSYLEIVRVIKYSVVLCSYPVHKRNTENSENIKQDKKAVDCTCNLVKVPDTFPSAKDIIEKKLEELVWEKVNL